MSFQERAGKPGGGKGILIQAQYGTGGNNTPMVVKGVDVYNGKITGNVTSPLTCNSNATSTQPIVLEGNGQRESHKGDGWKESETMYTLNTVEQHAVFENHCQDSRYKPLGDTCSTLATNLGTGGNNQPLVVKEPMCIGNGQADQTKESELVGALNCMHDQQAVMTFSDIHSTLNAQDGRGGVHTQMMRALEENFVCSYGLDRAAFNQGKNAQFNFSIDEELSAPNIARGPNAVCSANVRRLTPTECSRLQGFPDGWCDIGNWTDTKGKKHKDADSPKYKALGNSIAIPFWFWLLRRISAQYTRRATLGSLFDGIGGFPLCWEMCNGKGTARWASEIEEFPIAVTKLRFPENDLGGARK